MDKNKKVLVVDDSVLFSKLLTKTVNGFDGFEVCADARDPYEATDKIEKLRPDLILLDVEMPGMDGIHFLKKLMPQYPVPVVICTSKKASVKKALEAGAADFVCKPDEHGTHYEKFAQTLFYAMRNAINLREITCMGVRIKLRKATVHHADEGLILIGGSAGSTEALPKLLKDFTPDMPPVAATLHMPKGYTEIFAKRLDSDLGIRVVEAEHGMKLKRGTVVIAQGSKHLRVYSSENGFYASVMAGERISGHCPSVDALFTSAAELDVTKTIAVLLTGMGNDGANGLLKLRKAGAYTIGQDEESSLVYGMPKAAYEMGAVCVQSPLMEMSTKIKLKLKEWSK